jgi:hypothetical protein
LHARASIYTLHCNVSDHDFIGVNIGCECDLVCLIECNEAEVAFIPFVARDLIAAIGMEEAQERLL